MTSLQQGVTKPNPVPVLMNQWLMVTKKCFCFFVFLCANEFKKYQIKVKKITWESICCFFLLNCLKCLFLSLFRKDPDHAVSWQWALWLRAASRRVAPGVHEQPCSSWWFCLGRTPLGASMVWGKMVQHSEELNLSALLVRCSEISQHWSNPLWKKKKIS